VLDVRHKIQNPVSKETPYNWKPCFRYTIKSNYLSTGDKIDLLSYSININQESLLHEIFGKSRLPEIRKESPVFGYKKHNVSSLYLALSQNVFKVLR